MILPAMLLQKLPRKKLSQGTSFAIGIRFVAIVFPHANQQSMHLVEMAGQIAAYYCRRPSGEGFFTDRRGSQNFLNQFFYYFVAHILRNNAAPGGYARSCGGRHENCKSPVTNHKKIP